MVVIFNTLFCFEVGLYVPCHAVKGASHMDDVFTRSDGYNLFVREDHLQLRQGLMVFFNRHPRNKYTVFYLKIVQKGP